MFDKAANQIRLLHIMISSYSENVKIYPGTTKHILERNRKETEII